MPDIANYEEEDEWMGACVPAMIDEGREQDQAVAACMSMWREKNFGAVELPMLLTKAEQMKDGRIRWQARANTGEWDLERERYSVKVPAAGLTQVYSSGGTEIYRLAA